jgi:hypothetical protein
MVWLSNTDTPQYRKCSVTVLQGALVVVDHSTWLNQLLTSHGAQVGRFLGLFTRTSVSVRRCYTSELGRLWKRLANLNSIFCFIDDTFEESLEQARRGFYVTLQARK